MKLFNKVTIIGVGLIGGSVGLALKDKRLAGNVTGVFRKRDTLKKALKRKAVDKATMDIGEGVRQADLIIVSSQVSSIPALALQAARYAKKGAIITDVGSTKKWIVGSVEQRLGGKSGIFFVGSHPMAGSENTSVNFARKDLFKNAPCIVTKTGRTNAAAMKKIVKFWQSLGCNTTVMSVAQHDDAVALISHLPHVAAYSLAGSVPKSALPFAAEGFKDTTRIASSDPGLWADILLTNREPILRSLCLFSGYINKIAKALSKNDRAGIMRLLELSKSKRDSLGKSK